MPGPRARGLAVGERAVTAGRSPCSETTEAKCSGIVCGRRGGCGGVSGVRYSDAKRHPIIPHRARS